MYIGLIAIYAKCNNIWHVSPILAARRIARSGRSRRILRGGKYVGIFLAVTEFIAKFAASFNKGVVLSTLGTGCKSRAVLAAVTP